MGKSNESNNGSEFKEKTLWEKKIISRCKVQLGVTTTALTEFEIQENTVVTYFTSKSHDKNKQLYKSK